MEAWVDTGIGTGRVGGFAVVQMRWAGTWTSGTRKRRGKGMDSRSILEVRTTWHWYTQIFSLVPCFDTVSSSSIKVKPNTNVHCIIVKRSCFILCSDVYYYLSSNSESKSKVLLPEMKKKQIISLYVPNKLTCFFGCRGREIVGQGSDHGFLELDHLGLHSDTAFN